MDEAVPMIPENKPAVNRDLGLALIAMDDKLATTAINTEPPRKSPICLELNKTSNQPPHDRSGNTTKKSVFHGRQINMLPIPVGRQ